MNRSARGTSVKCGVAVFVVVFVAAVAVLVDYARLGQLRAEPRPATSPAAPPTIDVRELGAVGDGVADDTAAIQRAFDKVGVLGGTVRFPPGKYRVAGRHRLYAKEMALLLSAPVTPPLPIKLVGDGATLVHDAGDVKLLYVGDNVRPYTIDGFEMTGFRVVGTRTGARHDDIAQFNNTLIFLNRIANARVHHNQFERCTGSGIYFAQTRSTIIDHNQFVNANGGVQGTGSRNVVIDGNIFTCGIKCDDQIAVFGEPKFWSANVKIVNNVVDKGYDGRRGGSIGGGAQKPTGRGWARCVTVGSFCENVDISGNTLANCNSTVEEDRKPLGLGGVLLEAAPDALRNVQVRDNTITNCRWGVGATGGVDGLTIAGNTFRDIEEMVFQSGPSENLFSFSGVQFTGNRIKSCGKPGGSLLLFYMTDGLQVERNTFSDCAAARLINLADAAGKVTGQKSVFVRDNVFEKLSDEAEGTVIYYETIHDRLVVTGNQVSAKRGTHVHGHNLVAGAQVVIDGNTFEGWTRSPVFLEGWTGTPAGGGGNYCRPDGAPREGRWAAPIRLTSGWGGDGKAASFAAEPPKSGPWRAGDIVYGSMPNAGGTTGWQCVESGSPGKWQPIGQLIAPAPGPR